jgi:hypothetical protein
MAIGVAVVFALLGAVWVLQGFGLAPTGSFMDGSPFWGWLGAALLALAAGILLSERLRR